MPGVVRCPMPRVGMWLRALRHGKVPQGRLGLRGEWNGQCPINKQYSLKPHGPRASRSRGLARSLLDSDKKLAQGADCHREQKAHTLALPLCPPGEPAAPVPCTGPLGGWNRKETGLLQLSPILSGAAPWGRCRVGVGAKAAEPLVRVAPGQSSAGPSCSTFPGPPGAAAPHSSGHSAVTSGSSPPLQSDTCVDIAPITGEDARRPRRLRRGTALEGQDLDTEVPQGAVREAGQGTAHPPGTCCSGLGPLPPPA